LDEAEAAFIQDVLAHPHDGVRARYLRMGLSGGKGNRIKRRLVTGGWLVEAVVPEGVTRKVLLGLTPMIAVAGSTWWKAFITVAVTSGARKEEILNLTWRDIGFDDRTIRITAKTAEEFKGPGGKEYETIAWAPKTYAARGVPVPDKTIALIRGLKDESDGSPYAFISLDRLALINAKTAAGTRRARAETCNNVLRDFRALQREAAVRLGVKDWIIGNVHDIRRTYGTWMANAGIPMHTLCRWMGHSDIKVTQQFYLQVGGQHDEAARQVVHGMTCA